VVTNAALPGGNRNNNNGNFNNIGNNGNWWSSTANSTTSAWNRGMFYGNSSVYRNGSGKESVFSVRCIKDL
jgi:RNA-directed DNA polymerase